MALRKFSLIHGLRFGDPALEAAFLAASERQRLIWLVAISSAGAVASTVGALLTLRTQSPWPDVQQSPWPEGDLRVWWLGLNALTCLASLWLWVSGVVKLRCGRLRCVGAEALAFLYLLLFYSFLILGRMGSLLLARAESQDWTDECIVGHEGHLALNCVTTVATTTCVLRVHRLAPLVALSLVGWAAAAVAPSSGQRFDVEPLMQVAMIAVVDAFLMLTACRHERLVRGEFLHGRRSLVQGSPPSGDQSALASGMLAIAARLCDLVLQLDAELTVCACSPAADSLFGRPMLGTALSTVAGEAELPLIRTAFDHASSSQVPQCLPTKLRIASGLAETHLFITDTGAPQKRFIVGISVHTERDPSPAEAASSEVLFRVAPPGRSDKKGSDVATADVGGPLDAKCLEQIARLGRQEDWWFEASALQVPQPSRVLGAGGYGITFRARLHGQTVLARTLLQSEDPDGLRQHEALLAEFRILRNVRHPHVVSFIGAAGDLRSLTLVYEFICGMSLGSYIGAVSPPASHRLRLLYQTCAALRYLHAHRPAIVHGDLKAKSVLVEMGGFGPDAKLTGFGASGARGPRALTIADDSFGWAAPELYGDGAKATTCSDMFSVGWLAYLVLGGQCPFAGRTGQQLEEAVALMMKRRCVTVLSLAGCAHFREQCLDFCRRCLSFDPGDRPDIRVAMEDLRGWGRDEGSYHMGEALVSSMLPAAELGTGVENLLACHGYIGDEMQVDTVVSDFDIVVKSAIGSLGHVEAGKVIGRSLAELLESAEALKTCFLSTIGDIRRGAQFAPSMQQFGDLRFAVQSHALGADLAACNRTAYGSACMTAFFPDDSGVVSLRLQLRGAPPEPEIGEPRIIARL
mmetsp:Transcript_77835/g.225893  ORF Transcript_77835/g.225893 Transcript_77835/m.225893 type:complete len:862 (-) Transcript_77835:52-2637(-)